MISDIQKMLDEQLKPCPFCGGKARIELRSKTFLQKRQVKCSYVKCTQCHVHSGKIELAKFDKSGDAWREVVNNWNTRVEEKGGR